MAEHGSRPWPACWPPRLFPAHSAAWRNIEKEHGPLLLLCWTVSAAIRGISRYKERWTEPNVGIHLPELQGTQLVR